MAWKINADIAADAGLEALSLSLSSQASDLLKFSAPGRAADAAALYAYGAAIVLYKDATAWFRGKCIDGPRFGSHAGESHDYVVAGPWDDLDKLTFEQAWLQADTSTETKTHVVLGKDHTGADLDVGETIKQILDFAITKSVGLSYVQTELDALSILSPYDDQTDITCGEAIRIVLRWYRDIATWFDYSSATPVLHFTRRAAATEMSLDFSAGTIIEGMEIRARNDLVRTGVIINYELQNSESQWSAVDRDIYPVGTTSGLNTLQMTIVIGTNSGLLSAPVGLAETLYDAISVLHFDGSIKLSEDECTAGPRPGKVLNLSNGLAAWATMAALVQQVEFDIDSGSTAIKFGPPGHLGPQDYIELLLGNRNRNAGSGDGPGDEPTESQLLTGEEYMVLQLDSNNRQHFDWLRAHS